MSEDLKKELDKLFNQQNNNTSDIWLLAMLMLIFQPKQEPPIININLGSDKNVQ
jgi:hypothetical protein